jgi:hypothetical protein
MPSPWEIAASLYVCKWRKNERVVENFFSIVLARMEEQRARFNIAGIGRRATQELESLARAISNSERAQVIERLRAWAHAARVKGTYFVQGTGPGDLADRLEAIEVSCWSAATAPTRTQEPVTPWADSWLFSGPEERERLRAALADPESDAARIFNAEMNAVRHRLFGD